MTKQLLDYNEKELSQLAHKIVKDGQVVLHDQNMSKSQLVQACARFGNIESNEYFMNPVDAREISIVSGAVVNGKAIGMFGPTELEWHANGTGRYNFSEICVGLYCVTECIDTVLSICNQCDAFESLSKNDKEYYRNIDIQLDNNGARAQLWKDDGVYSVAYKTQGEEDFKVGSEVYKETIDRRPLVANHPVDGREYIYFMVPYISRALYKDGTEIENFEEFYKTLYSKIIKSKFMFHHVFRKGDLLFMDQLNTIHRRSAVKNKDRQLWRTAFDYSSVINYTHTQFT